MLTSTQAANELGITKSRLCQIIKDGRLTAVTFGNALMIEPSDLKAFKKIVRKAGRPKKK